METPRHPSLRGDVGCSASSLHLDVEDVAQKRS